ncbi:MAG: hypothetical protein M3069_19540, partial [Chloroflexota bacterium]|nr:hypothetical protein [Chloroflexota bacterium]
MDIQLIEFAAVIQTGNTGDYRALSPRLEPPALTPTLSQRERERELFLALFPVAHRAAEQLLQIFGSRGAGGELGYALLGYGPGDQLVEVAR